MVHLDTSGQNDELPGQRACPEGLAQTCLDLAFWGIVFGGGRILHLAPNHLNPPQSHKDIFMLSPIHMSYFGT